MPAPLWRPHVSKFALLVTCSLAIAAQGCSTLAQDGESGFLNGGRERPARRMRQQSSRGHERLVADSLAFAADLAGHLGEEVFQGRLTETRLQVFFSEMSRGKTSSATAVESPAAGAPPAVRSSMSRAHANRQPRSGRKLQARRPE